MLVLDARCGRSVVREIWSLTVGQFLPGDGLNGDFRLFPVGITQELIDGGKELVREDWRIWWPVDEFTAVDNESDVPGIGFSAQQDCLGWTTMGWLYYGNEALDCLVFIREVRSRKVVGLEIPYLRTGRLNRV